MGREPHKGWILIPDSLPLGRAGIRFAHHDEFSIEPRLFFQKGKKTCRIGLFLFPVTGFAFRTAGTPAILKNAGNIAPAEIFGELKVIAANAVGRAYDNGRTGA
jgi:hypothetical protein